MSSKDKFTKRLKSRPKDLTWDELTSLLSRIDFVGLSKGKIDDSRRDFYHSREVLIISLHKPDSDPVLKSYAIKQVIERLEREELI